MAIELTERAASHIKKMLTKRPQSVGFRIATKKSGCSGFAYEVDYADKIVQEDMVFEIQGLVVVVDKASLPLLDGMTVDFVKSSLLNEGFEFINPNVKEMCGCGESFSV
ncbi:MAG: iron-sulfur cluster assembly accessory protein [Candidatus Thiodiazotropha sp. (ex Monitilora ramsayi)]|nr:iron-sulfur cluster assembly accessory protein [Candidatus Thiodiazotropha sp. (ex Monitilora ramsayi)]